MNILKAAVAFAASGLMVAGVAIAATPAQAADCRYDQWGSNQWKGQKYKCPDGSTMYIKPKWGTDQWDSTPNNSWDKWKGTDNYGNRYNCTWDNWRKTWKCR